MPLTQKPMIDTENELFLNFTNSIESQFTKRTFNGYLRRYMEYHELTRYEQLMEGDRKVIQAQIIDFINAQKKVGLSAASIGNYVIALKHFYTYNDITETNWVKVKKFLGERQKTVDDRAYTKEEISKILAKCDERKRVLVLLLASTGMRIGAVVGLKIGNLKKLPEANLYRVTLYERTNDEYYTFTTPECAQAIDEYLAYRERCGETLGPKSPLIREQFDKKDEFAIKHPKLYSNFTLQKLLRDATVDAGIRTIDKGRENMHKRKEVMLAHGFRKYFNTMLLHAGVKPVIKEMLMGHSVGLEDNYFRPSEDEMLKEYLKAADELTISQEKKLKREVEKLKVENADIDLMKRSYLDVKLELEKEREARQQLYEDLAAAGLLKKKGNSIEQK